MYQINSATDKPDIQAFEQQVKTMMQQGLKVSDAEEIDQYFELILKSLINDINDEYGISNPNSSQQVIEYLSGMRNSDVYEVCNIGGKWTSNKNALLSLKEMGYGIARDLLQYRTAKKCSDSCKSMIKHMDEKGYVHPTVTLSKTNRINYSSPGIMTIPKKLLWNLITARTPGNSLWSADIKNQEPHIFLNLTGAKSLLPALSSPNGIYEEIFKECFEPEVVCSVLVLNDCQNREVSLSEMQTHESIPPVIYSPVPAPVQSVYLGQTHIQAYGTPVLNIKKGTTNIELPKTVQVYTEYGEEAVEVTWEQIPTGLASKTGVYSITGKLQGLDIECQGIERSEFKQAWNAMTYGASQNGIQKICQNIDGKKVYNFISNIPEIKKYQATCNKAAALKTQITHTLFNTELYANEYDSRKLARTLMNIPIQGTATDIMALWLNHCQNDIGLIGLANKIKIYYVRVDELIFEIDQAWESQVGQKVVEETLRAITEHRIDNWEPFKVEISKLEKDLDTLINGPDTEEIEE